MYIHVQCGMYINYFIYMYIDLRHSKHPWRLEMSDYGHQYGNHYYNTGSLKTDQLRGTRISQGPMQRITNPVYQVLVF